MKSLVWTVVVCSWCAVSLSAQSERRTLPILPDTLPPSEASQFDFLIGDWEFEAQTKNPRSPPSYTGKWTARSAFDGFGVTDEWRVLAPDGETVYLGASSRVYSRASGAWTLRFLNVFGGRWSEQHAEYRDGDMHLWWEGEDPDGPYVVRVRYYNIRENDFRWRMDRSYDDGATWIEEYLTMYVRRTPGP